MFTIMPNFSTGLVQTEIFRNVHQISLIAMDCEALHWQSMSIGTSVPLIAALSESFSKQTRIKNANVMNYRMDSKDTTVRRNDVGLRWERMKGRDDNAAVAEGTFSNVS